MEDDQADDVLARLGLRDGGPAAANGRAARRRAAERDDADPSPTVALPARRREGGHLRDAADVPERTGADLPRNGRHTGDLPGAHADGRHPLDLPTGSPRRVNGRPHADAPEDRHGRPAARHHRTDLPAEGAPGDSRPVNGHPTNGSGNGRRTNGHTAHRDRADASGHARPPNGPAGRGDHADGRPVDGNPSDGPARNGSTGRRSIDERATIGPVSDGRSAADTDVAPRPVGVGRDRSRHHGRADEEHHLPRNGASTNGRGGPADPPTANGRPANGRPGVGGSGRPRNGRPSRSGGGDPSDERPTSSLPISSRSDEGQGRSRNGRPTNGRPRPGGTADGSPSTGRAPLGGTRANGHPADGRRATADHRPTEDEPGAVEDTVRIGDPGTGGRRRRPDTEPDDSPARRNGRPDGGRRRPGGEGSAARPAPPDGRPERQDRREPADVQDNTVALRAGGGRRARPADDPERPTTTIHRYGDNGDPEPDDEHAGDAKAQHIDATLTRLTAAHAGLPTGDDEPDEEPVPTRRRRPGRLLVAAAVVAVLLACATGWTAQTWLASGVGTVSALDPGSGAILDAAAQQGADTVLLVATADGHPDTVALAHVAAGGAITAVAVPADIVLSRPPCDGWDAASGTYGPGTVRAEARSDLDSALDQGGPRCVTRAVQQLTGLAVTRYVEVDLDALGTAVTAVDGVTVCASRPVVDATLGPVAPAAGTVTLDTRQAGEFLRAAAVAGDPPAGEGRIERQQQVLAAVLGSVMTDRALLDLPRVAAVRSALAEALVTDGITLDQVLALSRALGGGQVPFRAVPTTADPDGEGSVPADADAKALFAAVRTAGPLPAGPDQAGPNPAAVKVDVLNGTSRTGQAAQVGSVLRSLGFTVGTVAGAATPATDTVIRFSPDQAANAALLAASVPSATTVADPGSTGKLQLVLGRSFDTVVKPPTTAPAPDPAVAPVSCA